MLFSCSKTTKQKIIPPEIKSDLETIDSIKKEVVLNKEVTTKNIDSIKTDTSNKISECELYWSNRYPKDSILNKIIDNIINENDLTKNNKELLTELKLNFNDTLVFEKPLSPIYRLSQEEIGIFSFPRYKYENNSLINVSKELDLLKSFDTIKNNTIEHFGKVKFYPFVLDSLFPDRENPFIYYYTDKESKLSQIINFGTYVDECLEYFEFSLDNKKIDLKEKLLFSSPHNIDVTFKNYPKIDSILKNQVKKDCLDCPNSDHFEKTFALLDGTKNVYFVYADTFPINDKLDTPSRGLIYLDKSNTVKYIWHEALDLFGCSCL